uniref:uncharacterized protein LOC122592139 n=1 Tax=Erigeron canadensis TaxID=72917 RepID=UPI001CB96871|nr:uncharacterized protein LOC122592139 [Erigeron canadensis]
MYDGKGDPDNHLKHFNGMIKMQRWNVPVAYHMFALTIKDVARAWVNGLPVGSVVNLEDLKRKFRSHFSQQRKYQKIHLEAHNIKRREGERIRNFITRYTDETTLIKGLAESQKISGFVHELRFKPLVEFLSTDLPQTYTALTDKTHSFLLAKDTTAAERSPPKPRPHQRGKDMSKFCEYHNVRGQYTNDCKVFKTKVEEAAKTGRLAQFLKGLKEQGPKDNQGRQDNTDAQAARLEVMEAPITMIIGEVRQEEQIPNQSEPWKSVAISFPPIDEKDASDDPIVIQAIIGKHQVKKVHLDTRSGCEIMYDHCFQKLSPTFQKLRKGSASSLIGFSGERAWSQGEVALQVTVGEWPRQRTEVLTFTIIRADSPYNVILGRVAVRKMGIIPSSTHAAIKFPTPLGIGYVKPEPLFNRYCAKVKPQDVAPEQE